MTVRKSVKLHSTNKPWFTGEVRSLLRLWDAPFRSGDTEAYNVARNNLKRRIREAKRLHVRKLAGHFSNTKNTLCLWQGFQTATGYKPTVRSVHNDPSLVDNLNTFFSQFEITDNRAAHRQLLTPTSEALQLTADSVKVFSNINPWKAAGPDNILGCVLKGCVEQLKDSFMDTFNISFSQARVPTCFKHATIILMPKTPNPTCMNDYRPVAKTPILMKCFEQLCELPVR